MPKKQTDRKVYEQFILSLLSKHLDNTVTSVKVAVEPPFILIHLSNFLLPTEENLLKKNEMKRLLEIRDVLMEGLKADMKVELGKVAKQDIVEIYADWHLEKETAMLIAVMDGTRESFSEDSATVKWPEDEGKRVLREQVVQLSKKTAKEPEHIEIYRMGSHAILIERTGTMGDLEIELIKHGAIKELRLAKRTLDHRLLKSLNAEAVLDQEISELFGDWDFDKNKAYIVLMLKAWTD